MDWFIFREKFLCSMWCCIVAFYSQNFKTGVHPLQPCCCVTATFMWYSKSSAVISTVFTASSPGVDSISRNRFLCSSVRNNSSSLQLCHKITATQSYCQALLLVPVLLLFATSTGTTSAEVPNSSKSGRGAESPACKVPFVLIISTSRKSGMFFMASTVANPFRACFAQMHRRRHCLWQLWFYKMYFFLFLKIL